MSSTTTGIEPLPWRLTTEAIEVIDARVINIIYAHGMPACSKEGSSFFKNMNRVWRSADKLVAFLRILVTVLRDYVPEVRAALRKFVWGLKLLQGRRVSHAEAKSRGIEFGGIVITETDIKKADLLIIEGLSMLEGLTYELTFVHTHSLTHLFLHSLTCCLTYVFPGSSPVDDGPPCEHPFVHYADATRTFGILERLWLMSFERFNKKVKNLVGNKNFPLRSLANALVRDAGMLLLSHTNHQHTHSQTHTLNVILTLFVPRPPTHPDL